MVYPQLSYFIIYVTSHKHTSLINRTTHSKCCVKRLEGPKFNLRELVIGAPFMCRSSSPCMQKNGNISPDFIWEWGRVFIPKNNAVVKKNCCIFTVSCCNIKGTANHRDINIQQQHVFWKSPCLLCL